MIDRFEGRESVWVVIGDVIERNEMDNRRWGRRVGVLRTDMSYVQVEL